MKRTAPPPPPGGPLPEGSLPSRHSASTHSSRSRAASRVGPQAVAPWWASSRAGGSAQPIRAMTSSAIRSTRGQLGNTGSVTRSTTGMPSPLIISKSVKVTASAPARATLAATAVAYGGCACTTAPQSGRSRYSARWIGVSADGRRRRSPETALPLCSSTSTTSPPSSVPLARPLAVIRTASRPGSRTERFPEVPSIQPLRYRARESSARVRPVNVSSSPGVVSWICVALWITDMEVCLLSPASGIVARRARCSPTRQYGPRLGATGSSPVTRGADT